MKPQSINMLRKSVRELSKEMRVDYEITEIQEKILSADLVVSDDLKLNRMKYTFAYKLNPLPLNPTQHQKKRKTLETETDDKSGKKEGVSLHNALTVVFHPFFYGFSGKTA
jgi:hypothetical protein